MKKIFILLIAALLLMSVIGCKSKQQKMMEEFADMTGQEQYLDMDEAEGNGDMEPNDDGLDDVGSEIAGVDDGDGNGQEAYDTDNAQITLNGGQWPDDAPESVPQLDGTITATVVNSMGAVVSYTEIDRETADEYAKSLEKDGWQKISETVDSDWMQAFFLKDGIYLDIEWESGDCHLTWTAG